MSLHVLPTRLAQAALAGQAGAARNPRNSGTCGLYDIAGRLGQAHRSPAYLCRTIDALIAGEAFPSPYPLVSAGRLVKGAHRDSRWPIAAVDAWFEDRLPPNARDLVDQAERVEIDSRLSARAVQLFGGENAA
jgi:predicted DNA-binding transcriptional regulator AlpA